MHSYDYIVVGGGGAGAVLARVLAEKITGTVALLEAGPVDDLPAIHDLARFSELGETAIARNLPVVLPEGQRARFLMPTSRVLGGSTSRNTCIWFRPPARDFAEWQDKGAEGWGPEEATRLFEALEARIAIESEAPDAPGHRVMWEAVRESGFDEIDFATEMREGIGRYRFSKTGAARQSSAAAFLRGPLPANLHILTETEVSRLRLDADHRIEAVETNRGDFTARAEVILSAGAIDTARLLLLSGIGPADELSALGITPRVDLPGVGRHLLDHPAAALNLRATRPTGRDAFWNYIGVLFANVADPGDWPDIEIQFGPEIYDRQTLQAGYPTAKDGFTAYLSVNRARSEGSVRLTAADVAAPLRIETDFFSDPEGYDLRVITEGLRLVRRVFAAPAFDGWRAEELAPGADASDDAALGAFARETALTGYHPAGTAKMGAGSDPLAVVDAKLRVRGCANLRVADASVMPTMVSVNIAATVMLIGMKAAELLAE